MRGSDSHRVAPRDKQDLGIRVQVGMSDSELARALVERHPDAMALAMARFDRVVRGILVHKFPASDDWRDARQEVFFALFRDIGSLREPSLLQWFVVGIAKNMLRAEFRRRRVQSINRLEPYVARFDAFVPARSAAHHDLKRLQALLLRLRSRERAIFVLRFVDQMSILEISATLGMSRSTVQRSIRRGWSRVREWAGQDLHLVNYVGLDFRKSPASCAS